MQKPGAAIIPFRWDLSSRARLGGLIKGEPADVPEGYYDELRQACAKVVARSENSQLVFVGRSPEHIFDYLSGAFSTLKTRRPLTLLQFSKAHPRQYWKPTYGVGDLNEAERLAFLKYLQSEAIDPKSLTTSRLPLRFVDMVSSGATFRMLLMLFKEYAEMQGADWNVVSKRLGFIGITHQEKNSPNTFRWQQSEYWSQAGGRRVEVKNVSTPWFFWGHAANIAEKVTPSFHRRRWFDPNFAGPIHSDDALKAVRRSVEIFDFAAKKKERQQLARSFAALQEFKEPWLRKLALDLKTKA